MKVSHEVVTVHTKHPFIIARGGTSEYKTVWVRIQDGDGVEGWGEAAPSGFYGESAETVVAALERMMPVLQKADAWSLDTIDAEIERAVRLNGSARSAVSAALHDLAGKRLGVPVYKLWGLDPAKAPQSSFTIGIAPNLDVLRQRVKEAEQYPVLKIKLGSDHDIDILETIRDVAPDKILRVDANAAWTPKHALQMVEVLIDNEVEFLEQPLPPHDIEGFRFIRDRSPLPIIADESCIVATDIPKLIGAVDGINIKLSKCGSLREALKMIAVARAHGLIVMCGCMIETSLGISAAAHFSPLLDYADFDGAALLADDPFVGATITGGDVTIPGGPGLGVEHASGGARPEGVGEKKAPTDARQASSAGKGKKR